MTDREPTASSEPGTSGGDDLAADVLVIGAGPAGLTAASALGARVGSVLVLEREQQPGGIPRHSAHLGYGVRDLRSVLSGPAYARRLVEAATRAGATIRTEATVTGWSGPRAVDVTCPQGRLRVSARAIVLATGARERPRAARLVAGDRPDGVFTTGQLQNLVHLHRGAPGSRAVVVGGELVSWSAVLTLREAGTRTVLMTSQHPAPETYSAVTIAGRLGLRVPVARNTRVRRVIGAGRVQAVELEDLRSGSRRMVACDTVVFTGDWVAEHELARLGGLELDSATRVPLVDTVHRTSASGVFAIGNLVHPVDTADVCAIDGRDVAQWVERFLDGQVPDRSHVRLRVDAPLRWISPAVLRPGDPAPSRRRLLAWTDRYVRVPHLAVTQDGRQVGRMTLPWPASPGRVFRMPSRVLAGVDRRGGDVLLSLAAR